LDKKLDFFIFTITKEKDITHSFSLSVSSLQIEMAKSSKDPMTSYLAIKAKQYLHNPIHYAMAIRDHTKLSKIISSLP